MRANPPTLQPTVQITPSDAAGARQLKTVQRKPHRVADGGGVPFYQIISGTCKIKRHFFDAHPVLQELGSSTLPNTKYL